jgi:hypothetical protein
MLKTKSGQRVTHVQYVPYNSAGRKVTFPIKGSVVVREKPLKLKFCIWTIDGNMSVFGETEYDLANFDLAKLPSYN